MKKALRLALLALTPFVLLPAPSWAGNGTWTSTGPTTEYGTKIGADALAIKPGTPATAFAGGYRLWKTTDSGATWSASDTGITNSSVGAIVIDPNNPNVMYAGSFGVVKSTNGGATWTDASNGFGYYLNLVVSMAIDPVTTSTLYAGLNGGYGLWKSTDSGANWVKSDTGMVAATIKALAIDPKARQVIYAGTELNGLWKSVDSGANWTASGLASEGIYAIVIDPSNSSVLYAAGMPSLRATDGSGSYGVFKSTDAGKTWTAINNGLPSTSKQPDGRGLAIDASTGALYLATYGNGVYRSTDGGASWSAFNDGIPVDSPSNSTGARNLKAIIAANGTVYAGGDRDMWAYVGAGGSSSAASWAVTEYNRSPASNVSLLLTFSPSPADRTGTHNLYVAGLYAGQLYFVTLQNFQMSIVQYTGGAYPVYTTAPGNQLNDSAGGMMTFAIPLGNLSSLPGLEIYAGFGRSADDMMAKGQVQRVFRVN